MLEVTDLKQATAGLRVGVTTTGAGQGMAQLTALLRQTVTTLPGGGSAEIRVLTAVLQPGDVTPHHSHRFPVTVCVYEGVFTLELDGHPAIDIAVGQAFIEPPNVPMTGRNRGTIPTSMTLFYVCDPEAAFADPV